MQEHRNGAIAKRFFKRLLRGLKYKPRRLITDGLRSYRVGRRAILPKVRRRTSRYLDDRAENSRRPTRRRDQQTKKLKSVGQAHLFLSDEPHHLLKKRDVPCVIVGSLAGGYRGGGESTLRV